MAMQAVVVADELERKTGSSLGEPAAVRLYVADEGVRAAGAL